MDYLSGMAVISRLASPHILDLIGLAGREDAHLFRSGYRLPTLVDPELGVDVDRMAFGGGVGNMELTGDFFVAQRAP